MLVQLSIRDIVLIDRLDIDFAAGMTVFTGETGAGKSILLDAFSLALGSRGDGSLVRDGALQGQVSAVFDLDAGHPARAAAAAQGLDVDGDLILRRVQMLDGRTRAFVNDQAVSAQALRALGRRLVEIHGQHDDRAMVETSMHRQLVDAFGGLGPPLAAVREAHGRMRDLEAERQTEETRVAAIRTEADFLRHALAELETLDAGVGEEAALAERRHGMQAAEKVVADVRDARETLGGEGFVASLTQSLRRLDRRQAQAPHLVGPAIAAIAATLAALDADEARLVALARAGVEAEATYRAAAQTLSAARKKAAASLDQAVNAELAPLKLDRARFTTAIEPEPAGADGIDSVAFWVSTNPGTRPGPMMKIASGGELARFMLALKVVLAAKTSAPTLVFDEIDTGVGGAVADAMGQRLARLASRAQVLAVTHAPQVAARAAGHFRIAKDATERGKRVATRVTALAPEARREEIARMLAGATITDEARAAAGRLLAET